MKRFLFQTSAWTIVAIGCVITTLNSNAAPGAPRYAEGELLVKFRGGPRSQAAEQARGLMKHEVKRNFDQIGWQHIRLPAGMTVEEGLAKYEKMPNVLAVEPDGIMEVVPPSAVAVADMETAASSSVPNDSLYPSQWYLPTIGAPAAWDVTTGSSNVVVAVFDTGVDYTHPDLGANMWRNPGESGVDAANRDRAANGIDDDANGYIDDVHGIDVVNETGDPMDTGTWQTPVVPASSPIYHGTFIAGVIGAVGNNAIGTAGLNWSVQIMAIRAFGGDFAEYNSGYWSDHLAAWDYIITMKRRGVNVRVVNHSYGGAIRSLAATDAFSLAGREGILSVSIAQNWAQNVDLFMMFPGAVNLPCIINVAASTETDTLRSSSGFGASTVHLAAPGQNLTSTWRGTPYRTGSGTSYACPLVVGAAALLLSVNPNLTIDELKAALFASVDQPSALRGRVITNGRLNVSRALEYLTNANAPAIVVMALPAGQRTDPNAPIQVTFNRPMNRASVEGAFVIEPEVTGTFEWTNDNRSFRFVQDLPFDGTTNYTVRLRGTAVDETGASLDGDFDRSREGSPADDFVWSFRFPIPNDDFGSAQTLAGISGSIQASNRYASVDAEEPYGLLFGDWQTYGSSVWYQWTAPEPGGWHTFDLTQGTAFDSLLAILVGERVDQLNVVAVNDNYATSQGSRVSFEVNPATNYFVVVAGKNSHDFTKSGNFQLRWYPTPPPFITSFTPTSAYRRQMVTINGTNFTGAIRVLFNGLPAQFTLSTNMAFVDLQLTATVPADATTGPITIETPHGNFTTTSSFTVLERPWLAARPIFGSNVVELSWPLITGFTLQRADNLGATATWTAAAILSGRTTNGVRYVTVTNGVPNRFFRLYRP